MFDNHVNLNKYVLEHSSEIKLISFDIFDTLIHRTVDPSLILLGLYHSIIEYINNSDFSIQVHPESARHEAYVNVAKVNESKGYDFEVSYPEFVSEWVKVITGDVVPELEMFIIDKESELECCSTFKNENADYLIRLAKEKNIPIALVSDMYLSKSTIENILVSCDYNLADFDNILVSSELLLLKRTGRLFEALTEQYSAISKESIFHFGDNILADGEMANAHGINGIVIRDAKIFKKYDLKSELHQEYMKDQIFIGSYISALYQLNSDELKSDVRLSIGEELLGPILSSFCHEVILRALDQGIKRLYFCSREGAVLKRVCDEIIKKNFITDGLNTFYLHTSRLSSFQSSLHEGISDFHLQSAISNIGFYSIKSVFKPFGFDNSFLQEIAQLHGVGDINQQLPPNFENWQPYINFVKDAQIHKKCIEFGVNKNNLFTQYLDQIEFFNDKHVGLVDVGWSGQIQYNICQAIKRKRETKVTGFYFGLRTKAHEIANENCKFEWVFCDESHYNWFASSTLQDVFILETLTRACHPTVIGYENDNGVIKPKFKAEEDKSRVSEALFDPSLAVIQTASVKYASFYSDMLKVIPLNTEFTVKYGRICIDKLVRFPDRKVTELFSSINNVSDLGSNDVIGLLSNNGGLRSFLAIPKSLWPYGQAVNVGKLTSLLYCLRRSYRFQPAYPRLPNYSIFGKIIPKSIKPSVKSNKVVFNDFDFLNFDEWEQIEKIAQVELSTNLIPGEVKINKLHIYKTAFVFIAVNLLKRIFRQSIYYSNDAISVKKLIKSKWFK